MSDNMGVNTNERWKRCDCKEKNKDKGWKIPYNLV